MIYNTATGEPVSMGEVLPDPLPAGTSSAVLSDADFLALKRGDKTWDAATRALVPNPTRVHDGNAEAIKPLLVQAMARLDQIIGAPQVTQANLATLQQLQAAVQDVARVAKRLVRLQTDTLDGTD